MELVGFIEDRYGITVRDEDLTPENFQSLVAIQEYVDSRRNSAS
jgi:acyl carrier protein